ncbi:MAG TPA: hypothetical protein VFZ65_16995 [Planctomycetota bacterium]|nr:hypothetical protein [Planctomycetota bacterium]
MDAPTAIALLWLAAALLAAPRAWRQRGAARFALVIGALLLASLHAFAWNRPIYFAGRGLLADAGFYEQRFTFKLAIGVVFAGLCGWFLWRAARWCGSLSGWERLALAAMAVDALYIATRTCSIDGWMPDAIAYEPGKSVLGLSLAAASLLALLLGTRVREEEADVAR